MRGIWRRLATPRAPGIWPPWVFLAFAVGGLIVGHVLFYMASHL